jgi:DNA-binding response OmpR family regulator
MKILIADADAEIVASLRSKLMETPDTLVESATCATDAWKILTTFRGGFDVAVVDLAFPDMSGIDLLKKIRRQPALQALPVVVFTALNDRMSVINTLALGVKHYVVKPAAPDAVRARLIEAIAAGA